MPEKPRIINRSGVQKPPKVLEETLIAHYIQEKAICQRIRALPRDNPLRSILLEEVYCIANKSLSRCHALGFLVADAKSRDQFAKTLNSLFLKNGCGLELGCGSGQLILGLTKLGWNCRGVDITTDCALEDVKDRIVQADILFYFDSVKYDLIIIDQVLEHIPPQDCLYFLCNLNDLLKKTGILVCCTPNRLTGPHDISRWFLELGARAEGTHFNEITLTEMITSLKTVGFKRFRTPLFPISRRIRYNPWTITRIPPAKLFEKLFPFLPKTLQSAAAFSPAGIPITLFSILVPNIIAAEK